VLLLAAIAASTTAQEVDWPILVTPGYQAAPRQEVYFSWLPVDGAIEYQLQVDVDANFSSPGIDQVTGWTHWCAGGFTVLEYNYWRVRARLATGWASWSARWVFTASFIPELVGAGCEAAGFVSMGGHGRGNRVSASSG